MSKIVNCITSWQAHLSSNLASGVCQRQSYFYPKVHPQKGWVLVGKQWNLGLKQL